MRTFKLVRREDVSGVSGTGTVAEGVEFYDGACAMRWFEPVGHVSTSFYASTEDILAIHGHGGATEIRWVSDDDDLWPWLGDEMVQRVA